MTACLCSRTLAQYSTDRYAGRLYCRVRNGTGCFPAALTVRPIPAILTKYINLSHLKETLSLSRTSFQSCMVSWASSSSMISMANPACITAQSPTLASTIVILARLMTPPKSISPISPVILIIFPGMARHIVSPRHYLQDGLCRLTVRCFQSLYGFFTFTSCLRHH